MYSNVFLTFPISLVAHLSDLTSFPAVLSLYSWHYLGLASMDYCLSQKLDIWETFEEKPDEINQEKIR